ncbi:MAG: ATP-dependent Clp protease ATP-binding subunit [Patescibacteria group bacterium]|nr:ATP-dependent Clp protease ATP-binding subunit [Patescibacteria group bacterium]
MFNFNLKEAAIFQAIKWSRQPVFRFAKPLKKLFLVLFIFLFLVFLYGFLTDTLVEKTQRFFLGLSIIFLTLGLISWIKESFLNSKLKKPELKVKIEEALRSPGDYNLAEFLSFEVAKAVYKSIEFARAKKFPEINSSILFYYLILDNPKLNFIFSRALLGLSKIKKIIEAHFKIYETQPRNLDENHSCFIKHSEDFQNTILESLKIAQKKSHQRIEIGDILIALAKHDLIFKKILIDSNLKVEDIENLTWWRENLEEKIEERKKFWQWKNLIKKGTLAKEWTAGYTLTLDKFSIDLSEVVQNQGFPEIIGHQKEIEAIERILARREINNVLIVGESGSGRKSMIYALAEKSVLGESLPEVNYKRVVQLDLPSLLAQTETIEETESILDTIFRETISAGNIILVIDELHNFIGRIVRPGVIDISGVLSSYLHLPQFQIVGITTFDGLHRYIEQNPSILALFEKVEVSEISEEETLMLLEDLTLRLEAKYKRLVAYPALRDIIGYCAKYISAIAFPEKAMDLLDEAMAYLAQTKDKILLPEHVAKIVSEKTQIPVGEIEIKEREILLNLEDLIHQRIINQEEAVKEVSAALRRARTEVTVRSRPMGCFLFLGPTGVGKTETSKAVAEIYFGSEEKMIRLDMSEFQAIEDIPRLLGAPDQEGLLTTPVRENPFSLILLDEIEKAHPNILNLFLQVLDEGHLTDGWGRKVDFKNTIIIATSNAGYQIILEAIKQKAEWSKVKEKLLDYLFEKVIFRPEFINRFDAVVVFKPLSKENLLDIAELLLQKLKKNLAQKHIDFVITLALKEKITELGYDPTFGARQMRRVIQEKVENVLAAALLSGKLKKGAKIEIDPSDFTIRIIN